MQEFNYSLLLVDDDQDVLDAYQHLMSIAGIAAKTVADPTQAMGYLSPDWLGVVLLDMYMPQMHGLELLSQIKQFDKWLPVIVVTGHGDIPMAVEAVKEGACEFVEKPIDPAKLVATVRQHLEQRKVYIDQKREMESTIKRSLLGRSAQLNHIRYSVSQFSRLRNHVVVYGEMGVGRHLVANLIHDMSQSGGELELLSANDAMVCEELSAKLYSFVSGTLIVDSPERFSEQCQRVFAQHMIDKERKGQHGRVIAIFEQNPQQLVVANKLVAELYYVLNQVEIEVPPLRKRPDDIEVLFHHYLKSSCRKLAKHLPEVEAKYMDLLLAHEWPGNVRELRNVAELYSVGIIKLAGKDSHNTSAEAQLPLDELVDDFEKRVIEDALFLHSGRISESAAYLQVPRKKLYLRMKKHNIDKDAYKSR